MSGSTYGTLYTISTWGESHGAAIGVTIDGCPAGLSLSAEDIQVFLNRRKPGQSRFTTPRKEDDQVEILSGITDRDMPIIHLTRNMVSEITVAADVLPAVRPSDVWLQVRLLL